jgi:hypothetical protein
MMMVAPTDRQQPWWVQQAETQVLFLWVFLYLGGAKSSTPPPPPSLSLTQSVADHCHSPLCNKAVVAFHRN